MRNFLKFLVSNYYFNNKSKKKGNEMYIVKIPYEYNNLLQDDIHRYRTYESLEEAKEAAASSAKRMPERDIEIYQKVMSAKAERPVVFTD